MSFGSYHLLDEHSNSWIKRDDLKMHIPDYGSWTRYEFDSLSPKELRDVLFTVAKFCIKLVEGISAVKAEGDSENRRLKKTPHQLCRASLLFFEQVLSLRMCWIRVEAICRSTGRPTKLIASRTKKLFILPTSKSQRLSIVLIVTI